MNILGRTVPLSKARNWSSNTDPNFPCVISRFFVLFHFTASLQLRLLQIPLLVQGRHISIWSILFVSILPLRCCKFEDLDPETSVREYTIQLTFLSLPTDKLMLSIMGKKSKKKSLTAKATALERKASVRRK